MTNSTEIRTLRKPNLWPSAFWCLQRPETLFCRVLTIRTYFHARTRWKSWNFQFYSRNESIFVKNNFALFHIVANLNDFLLVGKAHLPNWYLLLRYCPENTAWHFSEPTSTRSEFYKALFVLPNLRFSSFCTIWKIFF